MIPQLISEIDQEQRAKIRAVKLIATDMDGTLTSQGKFSPLLLATLEKLAAQGKQVLIITGRSAGWVQGVLHYLPVVGAIAENGGVFYPTSLDSPQFLQPLSAMTDIKNHRQQLATTFQSLCQEFPRLQASSDNQFRLSDWTFDVAGLELSELARLQTLCADQGWGFTYSNVQCHIKPQGLDKATGLQQVLRQYFLEIKTDQVLTLGDSMNDESLFNPNNFPLSVGVANISHYLSELAYQPRYLTQYPEVFGFAELGDV
jgi:HAD superfamily hydrolase (TIGR01484 family)